MTQQARNIGTSRFLNKNSAYIESLVSFILDTKPYHSKLTEINEEYRFYEEMHVNIKERLTWQNKADSHWLYEYYSNGNSENQKTKINRLYSHLFNTTKMRVGGENINDKWFTWEVTELADVPMAYSKKSTSGLGVSQVKLKRESGKILPLVQSIDWHQSLGAFQFFINKTADGGKINPTWQSGIWRHRGDPDDPSTEIDVINKVVTDTRDRDLDKSDPESAINKVMSILLKLRADVTALEVDLTFDEFEQFHEVYREIDLRLAIVEVGLTLPRTYESLISDINSTDKLRDRIKVKEIYAELQSLTSSLFFGDFDERSVLEPGLIYYPTVDTDILWIGNIDVTPENEVYEEWIVYCQSYRTQQFNVVGSHSGFIGSFILGERFESELPGLLSFDTRAKQEAKTGYTVTLIPGNRIAIHPNANLETWNIIKTNPIAYTRPVFWSDKYGYITDLEGTVGSVSFMTPDFPEKTTFILTYTGDGQFEMVNHEIPGYHKIVHVDTVFRDEMLGFTIHSAHHPYVIGDEYYFFVENELARMINPGMYFGYDVDAYDNSNLGNPDKTTNPRLSQLASIINGQQLSAPATLEHVQFLFDTRFKEFDFKYEVNEYSIHGRKYRATAVVDKDRPIYTTYKVPQTLEQVDGSVDLNDPDSNLPVKYKVVDSVVNDPTKPAQYVQVDGIVLDLEEQDLPDLRLYYADKFKVSYSDDGFNTDFQYLDGYFSIGDEITHDGLSFTIDSVEGKPFIAVIAVEYEKTFLPDGTLVGRITKVVESGDILSFEIHNPPPVLIEPTHLIAQYTPHIHMHARAFHKVPAARCELTVLSDNKYKYAAYRPDGVQLYETGGSFSLNSEMSAEGYSINAFNTAFSVDQGYGLYEGDRFTFNTFDEKPMFLVHGSVTGFTEPAQIDKWYWNGKIGFKVKSPVLAFYDQNDKQISNSPFNVTYLNPHHGEEIYTITKDDNLGGYLVKNDHRNVVGLTNALNEFSDENISFVINTASWGSASHFKIRVVVDVIDFFQGHDVVVLKSGHPAYTAKDGSDFWITKTTDSALRLSVQTDSTLLTSLYPESVPYTQFTSAQYGNSPELKLYDNWVPMVRTAKDSSTSLAQYYDPATSYEYRSSITGELIGNVDSIDPLKMSETVYFSWDNDFFKKYMPINSHVNLLTVNQGYSENVKTYITETLKLLIRPGPFIDDVTSSDDIKPTITDYGYMEITMTEEDNPKIVIEDDRLNGYVVGYDNDGFNDYEIANLTEEERDALDKFYDEGQPIEIYSLLQKFNLTETERRLIMERWQIYIYDETLPNPAEVPPVTRDQWEFFLKMLKEDPAPGKRLVDQFGIPNRGMGLDIVDKPTSAVAKTQVQDIMDQIQFYTKAGIIPSVLVPTTEVYLNVSTPTMLPPVGSDWDSHNGLITIIKPSTEVIINLKEPNTVQAHAWIKGNASRVSVPVTYISPSKIKLVVNATTSVKVDLVIN